MKYYSTNAFDYVHPYDKDAWEKGQTILFTPFLLGEITNEQRDQYHEDILNEMFVQRLNKSVAKKRHCCRSMFNKGHIAFCTKRQAINFNKKRKDVRLYTNARK